MMRLLLRLGVGSLLLLAASNARAQEATPPAEDHGRVRVGFNFNGGVGVGDGSTGPVFGATFRLGWQINRRMAAFAQGSVLGWASSERHSGNTTVKGAVGPQLTPLFAWFPSDAIELAIGPSFDGLLSMRRSSAREGDDRDPFRIGYSRFYFGAHGRAAFHLGGQPAPDSGRRSGFTIGLDLHPTYVVRSTVLFATVGVSADWY